MINMLVLEQLLANLECEVQVALRQGLKSLARAAQLEDKYMLAKKAPDFAPGG